MTRQAKKLTAVIFKIQNAINVYYANYDDINQIINKKVDKTSLLNQMQCYRQRYNELINKILYI